MTTQLRSYSKINLGLAIGPLRPDGFHALATVYQTLALHDLLTITASIAPRTTIAVSSNDARVPVDQHNTAWQMMAAALDALETRAEVHIHIDKRLPVQGGLGAGSANAAAALVGLEQELGKNTAKRIQGDRRLHIAARIGSDVPLFLVGGTVLGTGRGEQVLALADLAPTWCVVAAPALGVSTPEAFRDWDARHPVESQLTSAAASDRLSELSRAFAAVLGEPHSSGVFAPSDLTLGKGLAEDPLLALVRTGIENDFEDVVFSQYPLLGKIKRILAGSASLTQGKDEACKDEAVYAALSGSGSALFGLYQTEVAARKAHDRVVASGVIAFLTKTVPREAYWRNMLVRD